jgi:hypothetical protein
MRVRLLRLRAVIGGLALLCAPHPADAQQVGARQYTSEDNLADNFIDAIHQDSRGYIWFATRDGLSRFDGYSFTTYRQSDGLPHSRIYDVVEDRAGTLWVATREGLAYLVERRNRPGSRRRIGSDRPPSCDAADVRSGGPAGLSRSRRPHLGHARPRDPGAVG